jgi:hypothetical protein
MQSSTIPTKTMGLDAHWGAKNIWLFLCHSSKK